MQNSIRQVSSLGRHRPLRFLVFLLVQLFILIPNPASAYYIDFKAHDSPLGYYDADLGNSYRQYNLKSEGLLAISSNGGIAEKIPGGITSHMKAETNGYAGAGGSTAYLSYDSRRGFFIRRSDPSESIWAPVSLNLSGFIQTSTVGTPAFDNSYFETYPGYFANDSANAKAHVWVETGGLPTGLDMAKSVFNNSDVGTFDSLAMHDTDFLPVDTLFVLRSSTHVDTSRYFDGNNTVRGLAEVLTNATISVVPIPAALPLMLSGLGFLGFMIRRKKPQAG